MSMSTVLHRPLTYMVRPLLRCFGTLKYPQQATELWNLIRSILGVLLPSPAIIITTNLCHFIKMTHYTQELYQETWWLTSITLTKKRPTCSGQSLDWISGEQQPLQSSGENTRLQFQKGFIKELKLASAFNIFNPLFLFFQYIRYIAY